MNARALPWLLVAIAEALAILWLGWMLFASEPGRSPAEPSTREAAAPLAADLPAAASAPAPPTEPAAAAVGAASPTPVAPPPSERMSGCLVHGTLTMRDGSRLPNSVSSRLKSDDHGNEVVTHGSRDAPAFAWPDVPPGTYQLTASGSGVQPFTRAVVVPPDQAELRVDVVLEPSWLVRVLLTVPDGRPLYEALTKEDQQRLGLSPFQEVAVIALWDPIPDELPRSVLRTSPFTIAKWQSARDIGRAQASTLPARYAGALEMPEHRPAFVAAVLKDLVLARAQLAVGQDELVLVVDPTRIEASLATLRCVVVDAAGKPLADARVEISDQQSSSRGDTVDAEGRFERSGLHPGLLEFTVRCHGHHFPRRSITLRPGSVTDLGILQATSGRPLTIQFEGAAAEKRLGVTLTSIDPPSHPALGPGELRLSTQDGRVQVELADGRYRLHVRGAGGAVQTIDTRVLGDGPLVVRLAPEAVLQVDTSGTTTPTHMVLTNSDGVPVFDRWVTWRSRWNTSLLPGTYQVTTTPLGGAPTTRSLDVPLTGAALGL
ncbi:MAG: carboxypeptidase regulatory-like domain-containing protein [Planctomycetes bacterium]|nr:carboxypeptidase regulatory-like domain-containing protein [Planctomycetota bacterium]